MSQLSSAEVFMLMNGSAKMEVAAVTEEVNRDEYKNMIVSELVDYLNGDYTDEAIEVMAEALAKWQFPTCI